MAPESKLTLIVLSTLLVSACATTPQPTTSAIAAGSQTPWLRQTLDAKWLRWPPNDGFASTPASEVLPVGTMIDRFGAETGRFFSPQGDSYAARALPYVCTSLAYRVYRVNKPLHVTAGKAAAWFDEPGGAMQYETDQPAAALRDDGSIALTPDAVHTTPCAGAE